MIRGTGPPPPLGDHPNGIDISHPDYTFDSVNWHETPSQSTESHINDSTKTLRLENDTAYKSVGNPTTWNTYISFGYYAYDHCFQFETQWERMKRNEEDTLKFIWASYCYKTSRALAISTQMERWAKDIAQPYLLRNSPSSLHVDVTDPRQARKIYEEPELMEIDDDDSTTSSNKKPAAKEDGWTEVQRRNKTSRSEREAIATPLPNSPPRSPPNTPTPPNPTIHNTTPTPITQTPPTTTQGPTHVHLNDGTLRVTVRWKPENFSDLLNDDSWNLAATDTIHYILSTVSDATLFPWMNGSTTPNLPSLELTPDNILQYLAPRVTNIESQKMFVFSFRLCLTTGPGKWINNPETRRNFEQHKVVVNLSNSSSDSGDTISTAGYIFFKHPKHTQRVYFLSHLRRHLPETTPFFDIGFHKKTPTGQDVPHLTIRCGENHVGPLTEILSAYLDGSSTTVFLGRLLLSKMSAAEVDAIFQTHADYLTNTRILSLAPTIQNLDIVRTESRETGNINRTTREWATSLKDDQGNNLQCDAENGGASRKAQLLVPVEHLELAKQKFQAYRECVSTFNKREAEFTNLIQEIYPQAIYVPTRAVHDNLALIQKRSAYTVWEKAPSGVRSVNPQVSQGYRPPTLPPATPGKPKSSPFAKRPNNVTPTKPPEDPKQKQFTQQETEAANLANTDDTVTTHSQMTKSFSSTQNRFSELESTIRRQQKALKDHNIELQQINERAIITLDLCQQTSTHVLELREDTTNQLRDIRANAEAQAQEQRESFARMTELIANLTSRISATASTHLTTRSSDTSSSSDSESDSMSVNTHASTHPRSVHIGPSPRVKKNKRKTIEEENLDEVRSNLNPSPKTPPSDQDKGAQYNEDSTPDAGDT
jgi:hypothetical protein